MQQTAREILLEKILESYYGTILAIDKDGKVVYFNSNVLISTKDLTREYLQETTLYELVKQGYYSPSPSLEVLRTKQQVTMQLGGRVMLPLITTSVPIMDEDGELEYVTAFSQDMAFVNDVIKKADFEHLKSVQIMRYANEISDNMEYVAESEKTKSIFCYLKNAAASDSTIVLYGESGTGKEVMAKYIYMNSKRKDEVYIPVNCAAFPPELMESELFGYEKGSFTGANRDGKIGLFQMADGGTIFLDEVSELPFSLQSKLLRVLENGEVKRIGGNKIETVNIRIIAATNRDLLEMVNKKQFREDLYYRLNVIPVTIPPIRERREDILPLCYTFLNIYNQKNGQSKILSMETLKIFEAYDWPGNIREIRNTIERLYVTSSSDILSLQNFSGMPLYAQDVQGPLEQTLLVKNVLFEMPYKEAIKEFERQYCEKALSQCDGNVSKAAKTIGISRSDFYYKLKKIRKY